MSLKVFHVIFVVMAVSLAVFCAIWGFGTHAAPAFNYGCVLMAVALLVYGIWFLRKARHIIT
jgi:hypothetical protein